MANPCPNRALLEREAWTKPSSDVQELFFNAAAPRNFSDLSVNPKQLDKLKALFLERESGTGHIILVTGPAGSGKTSSINVTAEFLKFEVVKWERSGNVELVNYAGDSYFKEHLCISELEFNPVASTFMRKALRRTLDVLGYRSRLLNQLTFIVVLRDRTIDLLNLFQMTVHDYRAVEKIANGDLRNAVNVIQFSLLCNRDSCITCSDPCCMRNEKMKALLYLKWRSLYAKIYDDLLVMMFLHEHEPNFTGSIGTLRHVLDSMSISDALSSDWTSRPVAQEYCSQICARATVFHNYGGNRSELGFYSYSRPKWFPLTKQIAELRREIRDEMPLSETRCADNDVPYLSLLNSSLSSSQFRLVSYLARPFNFQWTTSREFWDHQLSVDPSYRMVQYRESTSSDVFVGDSQEEDCSGDEEAFVIEESDADPDSDGSFDDSVVYS
ncbi:unnamed protein product [Nippostrongylus brasiliensis]|uniref:Cell cycle checkpoint RAD17 n=1 Tax=Nippostrongylus brasiliensis TaxID=27835 RepID=A0A158R1F2_NIPBR|nr:unnamed protein product [Nippostrongylus brasiliensis]